MHDIDSLESYGCNSNFLAIEGHILETVQDKLGGKLVLITNRKSCMSFRLVPKSVTLNDLEWRNGPYIALNMSINKITQTVTCRVRR